MPMLQQKLTYVCPGHGHGNFTEIVALKLKKQT